MYYPQLELKNFDICKFLLGFINTSQQIMAAYISSELFKFGSEYSILFQLLSYQLFDPSIYTNGKKHRQGAYGKQNII